MPIHHLNFYILISIIYIDAAGKSFRNASNLTVETVNIRGVKVLGSPFTVQG